MTIKDIMTERPVRIGSDDTILDAIKTMKNNEGIRHLPVLQGKQLVGIVSASDIRDILGLGSGEPVDRLQLQRKIGSVMTKKVITVAPEDPIIKAAHLFAEGKFGSLPVIEKGELVGILTTGDLFNRLLIPLLEEATQQAEANEMLPPEPVKGAIPTDEGLKTLKKKKKKKKT